MKTSLLFLSLFMLITLSCKKDEKLILATIKYSGGIAADGCGWLVRVDNVAYSPTNLDSAFMTYNLSVLVSFDEMDDSLTCGYGLNSNYPLITILKMKQF